MKPNELSDAEVVCLVDDDPGVLKSIGRLLASDGFAVRSFSEPKAFLDHVEANEVQLAILDVWMEQMTGLELQIKLARLSPHTQVIVMTGGKDSAAQETALQFGAIAFFTKPFDDEEFLSAVRTALATRA